MIFDLPPDPPKFWLPKPAIIRPATDLVRPQGLIKARRRSVGSPPATIAFLSPLRGNSSNLTTYNFTAHNLGAADSDRIIGVALGASGGGTPTGNTLTVDGFGLTKAVTVNSGSGNYVAEIWMGAVGGVNTSGTVSITFSRSMFDCCIAVFGCRKLKSITPTATDTELVDNTAMTAARLAGGVGIGVVITGSSNTWNWSGDAVDQGDVQDGSGNLYMSAAMASFTTGGTATFTPDAVTGAPSVVACMATFR